MGGSGRAGLMAPAVSAARRHQKGLGQPVRQETRAVAKSTAQVMQLRHNAPWPAPTPLTPSNRATASSKQISAPKTGITLSVSVPLPVEKLDVQW